MLRRTLGVAALAAMFMPSLACAGATAFTQVRDDLRGPLGANGDQLAKAETWTEGKVDKSPDGVEPAFSNRCFTRDGKDASEVGSRCYKLVDDTVYRRTVTYVDGADAAMKRFRALWDAYAAEPRHCLVYVHAEDDAGMPCVGEFDGARMKPMMEGATVLKGLDDPAAPAALASGRLCAMAQHGAGPGITSSIELGPHVLDSARYVIDYTDWNKDPALAKRAQASREAMARWKAAQKAKPLPPVDTTGLSQACGRLKRCLNALGHQMPAARSAYESAWKAVELALGTPTAETACDAAMSGYASMPNAPEACK